MSSTSEWGEPRDGAVLRPSEANAEAGAALAATSAAFFLT